MLSKYRYKIKKEELVPLEPLPLKRMCAFCGSAFSASLSNITDHAVSNGLGSFLSWGSEKIFGKEMTLTYPVPRYFKDSMIKKLNKKYLNGTSKDSEYYKLYKIDDETVIKRLGKPLKRGENGIPLDGKIVLNGSFMRCYQAEIDKYKVKRYESLRVLCEDIRKTSKKNVGAIEVGMLPMDNRSF